MVATGLGDPTRYLLPGETAVVAVRRHFMVLAAALLETLGFIAIALMLTYLFETVSWVATIGALLVLFSVLRFGYNVLEWRMERYVITHQRMMLVGGVLTRRVGVIPISKITDLTYEKPFIGQLFGYGTFIVESAGQDQAMSRIDYLPSADRLYRRASRLLFSGSDLEVPADEYDESRLVPVPHDDAETAHAVPGPGALEAFQTYDDAEEFPTGPIDVHEAAGEDAHALRTGKDPGGFTESRPPRWTRRARKRDRTLP